MKARTTDPSTPYNEIYQTKITSLMCLYVLIRSTLNFLRGAVSGSRKCVGILACIARMSVDEVGLRERCKVKFYVWSTHFQFSCPLKSFLFKYLLDAHHDVTLVNALRQPIGHREVHDVVLLTPVLAPSHMKLKLQRKNIFVFNMRDAK